MENIKYLKRRINTMSIEQDLNQMGLLYENVHQEQKEKDSKLDEGFLSRAAGRVAGGLQAGANLGINTGKNIANVTRSALAAGQTLVGKHAAAAQTKADIAQSVASKKTQGQAYTSGVAEQLVRSLALKMNDISADFSKLLGADWQQNYPMLGETLGKAKTQLEELAKNPR